MMEPVNDVYVDEGRVTKTDVETKHKDTYKHACSYFRKRKKNYTHRAIHQGNIKQKRNKTGKNKSQVKLPWFSCVFLGIP